MILPLLILSRFDGASGAKPVFPFSSNSAPFKAENAYKKYDKYPPYCSIPEEMEKRAVPPLQGESNDGSSQLVHVTALIRHGARTPWQAAPYYQCWNGYWEDEQNIWDCDLKTYTGPPAATKEKGRQDEGLLEEDPDFLFEKRYDALAISPDKTGNLLSGTCQLGQLIMRGYDQELRNGLHLRQAYFYDGNKTADEHAASDSRMRLWDLTNDDGHEGRKAPSPAIGDSTKQIYQEPNLHYRADDEQRTLMSGQILLRGLFESELLSANDDETAVIRLHTADYSMDVLGINHAVCPRAWDLHNEAYESEEYKNWIKNSDFNKVNTFVKEELGLDEIPRSMLDCLMTTICTDRTLPENLNNYDGNIGPTPWEESDESFATTDDQWDGATFERIANFAIKNFTFAYKHNNGAYAKLGMGPLWKEIMTNILPIIDSANAPSPAMQPPKLALFSGHDTTLMPILATLGDDVWSGTEWAPYASMLQIEIHEITNSDSATNFPSGYAFRLIYNGEVLTSKMDGCDDGSELCDSKVLVNQVMPFAKYQERQCASTKAAAPPGDGVIDKMENATKSLIVAPGGVLVIVVLILFSMIFGGILTWSIMRRRMQNHGYRENLALGELSMEALGEDTSIDSAVLHTNGGNNKNEARLDENTLI